MTAFYVSGVKISHKIANNFAHFFLPAVYI